MFDTCKNILNTHDIWLGVVSCAQFHHNQHSIFVFIQFFDSTPFFWWVYNIYIYIYIHFYHLLILPIVPSFWNRSNHPKRLPLLRSFTRFQGTTQHHIIRSFHLQRLADFNEKKGTLFVFELQKDQGIKK